MRRFATFQIYDYRQHFDQAPLGVVVMDQMPSVAYCCHTKPDRVFQYPGDARILIPGNIVGDTFDQTAGYAAHALLAFASTGVQALSAVDIWSAIGTEWSPPDFDNYHYCRALLQAAADKFGMDIEWRYLLPSSFQMKKDIINGTRIVCQFDSDAGSAESRAAVRLAAVLPHGYPTPGAEGPLVWLEPEAGLDGQKCTFDE
ncbi:Rwdd2b, partial [Symbiodinium microadriaticum]